MKRGNVEEENRVLDLRLLHPLNGVTLEELKNTFEKIGDYPKPVPKLGRPELPKEVKAERKLERLRQKTGQTTIIFNK